MSAIPLLSYAYSEHRIVRHPMRDWFGVITHYFAVWEVFFDSSGDIVASEPDDDNCSPTLAHCRRRILLSGRLDRASATRRPLLERYELGTWP